MKNFSQKIIASLIIFSLILSLSQFIFIKKVNAQSVSGDSGNTILDFSGAVGKAIGAGIACYGGHLRKEQMAQPVSEAKAATEATAAAGPVAAAAAAGIATNVPVTLFPKFVMDDETAKIQAQRAATEQKKAEKSMDSFEKCFKGVVIEILMDYIIDQIVDWIQNGGDFGKRFDMGNFEEKAKNAAFGEALSTTFPFLCSSFQNQIRLSFMPVPIFSTQISCTLDQITGNINNFMNNFNQGGWLAYNTMWEPQNNYFGASLMISDQANSEVEKAGKKASDELNRGAGFLTVTKCSVQINSSDLFQDNNNNFCMKNNTVIQDNKSICTVAYVQDSENNWCKKEDLKNVTPGRVVGDLVQKSVVEKGTFGFLDIISTSDDVGKWVEAIINAIYNRIIKEGLAFVSKSTSLNQSGQGNKLNELVAQANNSTIIFVAKNTLVDTPTTVGGSSGVLVGSYKLTAEAFSSTTLEKVIINNQYNVFSNFYIAVNGAKFGSNNSSSMGNMVFSDNVSIAASSSTIVEVYADISPGVIDETKSPATSFKGCIGTALVYGSKTLVACDPTDVSGQDVNTLSALALTISSSSLVQNPLTVTSSIVTAITTITTVPGQLIGEYSIFNRSSDKNIALTSIKITNASTDKFKNLTLKVNDASFSSSGSGSNISFSGSAIIPFNSSAEVKVYADVSSMQDKETVNNATTLNSCSGSGGFACYPVNVLGQSVLGKIAQK